MLRDSAHDHRCVVHAYVLMTNHVHLLVTPDAADAAAEFMKSLGEQYVRYMNRRHDRSGSLWEGRFRSSIVQTDSYFLTCQRYIELNPVRAGMAQRPEDYRWSSYRANAFGDMDDVLTPHDTYLALGVVQPARQASYRSLFCTPIDQNTIARIRSAANGNFVLGSADFAAEVAAQLNGFTVPRRRGRVRR